MATPGVALKQPRDLPPAAPPAAKPEIEIVPDTDVVASWRATLQLMTKRCDGNRARAEDLLMTSPEARDVYKRATKEWATREAKRRGVVSVTPEL